MSPRPFLPLSTPVLGPEEESAVVGVLRSGWLTTGARAEEFEERLAERCGARYALAVSSCTAALHLSLVGLGVGAGDEVVVPAITFPATASVVVHAGARPVVVDVDPSTLNLDPDAFEAAITARTRAVIPVHLAGLPADLERITAVAHRAGIAVVEDAAHALGSTYGGAPVGGTGHSSTVCLSFHPTKNLTTIEGGAVLTDDAALAASVRLHRTHGLSTASYARHGGSRLWEMLAPGFKNNFTDVQAAVGLAQLDRLDGFLAARERLAARYLSRLAEVPSAAPVTAQGAGRAWHLLVVHLPEGADRDEVRSRLVERGIGTGVHFPSLHLQPWFRENLPQRALPVAAGVDRRLLSLPLHPGMTEADVDRVVDDLAEVLG